MKIVVHPFLHLISFEEECFYNDYCRFSRQSRKSGVKESIILNGKALEKINSSEAKSFEYLRPSFLQIANTQSLSDDMMDSESNTKCLNQIREATSPIYFLFVGIWRRLTNETQKLYSFNLIRNIYFLFSLKLPVVDKIHNYKMFDSWLQFWPPSPKLITYDVPSTRKTNEKSFCSFFWKCLFSVSPSPSPPLCLVLYLHFFA